MGDDRIAVAAQSDRNLQGLAAHGLVRRVIGCASEQDDAFVAQFRGAFDRFKLRGFVARLQEDDAALHFAAEAGGILRLGLQLLESAVDFFFQHRGLLFEAVETIAQAFKALVELFNSLSCRFFGELGLFGHELNAHRLEKHDGARKRNQSGPSHNGFLLSRGLEQKANTRDKRVGLRAVTHRRNRKTHRCESP